jgi:hypothetical protein
MRSFLLTTLRRTQATLDFLVDLTVLPGANALGLIVLFASFVPLVACQWLQPAGEAAITLLAGIITFAFDTALRRTLGKASWWDYDHGGRLLWLPLWLWGLLWGLLGLSRLVLELLA